MDSARLSVLKSLTELLEGITPANGFAHDLSASVYRGKSDFGVEVSKTVFLSIIEAPEQFEPSNVTDARQRKVALKIQIWGVTASYGSSKHPADEAYALLADTQRRLGQINNPNSEFYFLNEQMAGPLLMDAGVVRAPEDGICKTPFFVANMTLPYVETLLTP